MAGFLSKFIPGSGRGSEPEKAQSPDSREEKPLGFGGDSGTDSAAQTLPPRGDAPPSVGVAVGVAVDVGATCDIGSVRQVNQDRVLALIGDAAPADVSGVFVVSDGMGGHAAGEVAAQMAVDGVKERSLELTGGQFLSSSEVMRSLMVGVNIDVHTASFEQGQQGMGATLTVCALIGSVIAVGHIGDSRAYVLRDGVLNQITPDHSWVMEMVARGMLTPEQAETHPRRNVLTRALGIDRRVDAHIGFEEAREGDALLLCSDGLHGVVSAADIVAVMRRHTAQDACDRLTSMANRLGGPDNISVVIARLNRLDKSPDAAPPPAGASAKEIAAATMPPGGL